ncbi:MAG: DNA double-strand break repair nuclease NurA, partial [Candidatus Bathyarchaeia archaeon]
AAVDGSDSPVLSERVGARYGTYAAGYMIFHRGRIIDEDYQAGSLSRDQLGNPEVTVKTLRLLTTKLEREVALKCLDEKGVDLVLLDGSFFGFRAGCNVIRRKRLETDGYRRISDLIDEVRDLSLRVLESRRAVGVVKRVRTSAIDGWIAYKEGVNRCLHRNDRAILTYLMPEGKWFDYGSLFQKPEEYQYYTLLKGVMSRSGYSDPESALKEARREFAQGVKANLNMSPAPLLKIHRYFHRPHAAAPPFCFEMHRDMSVEEVAGYFTKENCSPATGFPYPIDLIDENVTLPSLFAKEFVEEVEAILLSDPSLDKTDLFNWFTGINPQKEE